jgi:hypothetical protein
MKTLLLIAALACIAASPPVAPQIQAPPQPDFSAIQAFTAAREKQFAEKRCAQEALKPAQATTQEDRAAGTKACQGAQ